MASRASTGLRTIALRLRGMSDDGESLATNTAKLEDEFNELGLTLFELDGSFKSTFDILGDLSGEWDGLSDTVQASLTYLISGIRRSDILTAALSNMKNVTAATAAAMDSYGSALKENAIYMESIEAKTKLFKKTVEDLWINTINAESIKTLVDFGTSIIKIADSIGLANIAFIALAGIIGAKLFVMFPRLAVQLGMLATQMGATSVAAGTLGSVLSMMIPVAILIGAIAIIDGLTTSTKELEQEVATLTVKYNDLDAKIKNLKKTNDKTDKQQQTLNLLELQLTAQETLLDVERKRLATRKLTNNAWMEFVNVIKGIGTGEFGDVKVFKDDAMTDLIFARWTTGTEQLFAYKNAITNIGNEIETISAKMQSLDPDKDAKKIVKLAEEQARLQLSLKEANAELGLLAIDTIQYYDILEQEVPESIQQLVDSLDILEEKEHSVNTQRASSVKTLEHWATSYANASDSLANIASLSEELAEVQGDLGKTTEYLINNYDELVEAGIKVQEVLSGQISLEQAVENATLQANAAKAQSYFELSENTGSYLGNTSEQWGEFFLIMSAMYGEDMSNWVSLDQAKLEAENMLIKRLGKNWAKYFNASIKGIRAQAMAAKNLGDVEVAMGLEREADALVAASRMLSGLDFTLPKFVNNIKKVAGGTSKAAEATQKWIDLLKEQLKIQEDMREDQITYLKNQLDLLNEQYDAVDRLLKLEEARLNLANVEKQKNVRLLTDEGWKMVANPAALREAQKVVTELETEMDRDAQRSLIQDQIDVLELQKNTIGEFVSDMGLLNDKVADNVKSWAQLISAMQGAGISFNNIAGMGLTSGMSGVPNSGSSAINLQGGSSLPNLSPSVPNIPNSTVTNQTSSGSSISIGELNITSSAETFEALINDIKAHVPLRT